MAKGISNNIPPPPSDDNFSHRYAGGVNQYGTKGDQKPEQFKGYMNDGMTHHTPAGKEPSPMNVMSSPNNTKFGAPPSQSKNMKGAAAENFGPPAISNPSTTSAAKFGAPGFDGEEGNVGDLGVTGKVDGPPDDLEDFPTIDDGVGINPPGKEAKEYTYAKVEKMMTEQMIMGAIARMKIKSSDPGAWK